MADNLDHLAPIEALDGPEDRTAHLLDRIGSGDPIHLPGHPERRAPLAEVTLPDTKLRAARLAHADLSGADLARAFLAQADLTGAILERTDLSDADLSHADLSAAQMGEVILARALMEDARLDDANLRFADLREAVVEGATLARADLWGAQLEDADFTDANLAQARIGEAFACRADFTRADLTGCTLVNTRLIDARFVEADLRQANLKGANLSGADLSGARLQELDLSTCDLTGTRWRDTQLHRTRLDVEQLGGVIAEETARDHAGAARSYAALERNFASLGEASAASWAYRRRRRMQKHVALGQARACWSERNYAQAAAHGQRYIADQLVELVCDYGESVPRVAGALLSVYLFFLVIYGLTDSVSRRFGADTAITHRPVDLAIFSLMAMTTSGTPSVGLMPSNPEALLLSGTQALLGIFLTGLLGFVAGNRIRR